MSKRTKKEVTSYKMSRVRAQETSIEKAMGSALWKAGLRGYRKNVRGITGTPDFCWRKKKIIVFCDSSFWHGHDWRRRKKDIKVRKKFWFKKIEDNIARDKKINKKLKRDGWNVLRFWDFDIKKKPQKCIQKVTMAFRLK